VSRSLLLPFMIALFLHVLLSRVELNLFKGPLQERDARKSLSLHLVRPVEKKDPSEVPEQAVLLKKQDKGLTQPAFVKKPAPEPVPAIKKKAPDTPKPLPERQTPRHTEVPAYLPPPNIPREIEKKQASKTEYAFVPDRVDIPTAFQKRQDLPPAGQDEQSPLSPPSEPITLAAPNYKKNTSPAYPLSARKRNYEGTVLLDVLVRKDGTVGSVRVAQSSGHEALDQAAIRAVAAWNFHPGKRGDEPLEMWVAVPIRFQLR
jgi:protein TonB